MELVNHLAIGSTVRAPGCLKLVHLGGHLLKGRAIGCCLNCLKFLHLISLEGVTQASNRLNTLMLMKIWVKTHNMVALECKNILSMSMLHTQCHILKTSMSHVRIFHFLK